MEGRFRLFSFLLLLSGMLIVAPFHDNLVLPNRSAYIVHMDRSVMPRAFISHHQWYSSILNSIKSNSFDSADDQIMGAQHVYTYENALHGFCALLSEEELEFLKKSPGFLLASKDGLAQMHTTHTTNFLSLNSARGLWHASHFGEDVIVGVIDSGVWPECPSFRDDGMTAIPSRWKGACEAGQDFNSSLCNLKLIGARYFNKGLLALQPNITLKMNSTRDTSGHGTHTSSTVAGNYVEGASFFGYAMGTARGVAPRARLAMYKVISLEGATFSDILAGMDQAVADGVDIISISLADPTVPQIYQDHVGIASFGAMERGILVSCSAGNSGPFLGSLQNGIPWAMTVGASSIDRSFGGILTLGNGLTIIGWSLYPVPTTVDDLPLIYSKTFSACNSSDLLSTANGIVICDADIFSVDSIIANSTVTATIFFSDDSKVFDEASLGLKGVVLSTRDKEFIINYAKNDVRPSASIRFNRTFLGTKPAPAVADYSSRGPAPRFPNILKPDIMAPGTLVLAAWIPNGPVVSIGGKTKYLYSGFNLVSGTSMSCPHAAGIAALLKEAHPEWSPAAIRSAMMTTASTLDNTGNPIRDIGFNYDIASPLAMGAGQVNPNGALDPGLVYDATTQDYINLLCSLNLNHSQISAITRSTSYDCSFPSADLNYPSFIVLYKKGNTTVLSKTFRRKVTNVGNGAAKYEARVIPPKGSTIDVSPQELRFRETHEKQSYSLTIKYAGDTNGTVSFGSLTWIEVGGKHTVRSPILVSPVIDIIG